MEEAPESYKNVTDVVDTCHAAGISKKCIKLRPIGVIKGWTIFSNICQKNTCYVNMCIQRLPTFVISSGKKAVKIISRIC